MSEGTLIREFENKLSFLGYSVLDAIPKEIKMIYKLDGNAFNLILNIDYHTEFQLTLSQYHILKEKMIQLFYESNYFFNDNLQLDKSKINVELFTIFWCEQMNSVKEILQTDSNCWYVDLESERLIIYEHQRPDFNGIRPILDNVLYRKSDGNNRSNSIFVDVKPQWMNLIIVLVNIIVYIILEVLGDTNSVYFMLQHGAMYPDYIIIEHQWFRFISAMFMHFGIQHLINNMIILVFLGDTLEYIVGKIKYLIIYLLSGLSGGILSMWYMYYTGDYAVSAGASGAVFGVIGALLYISIRTKGRYGNLSTRRFIFMIAMSLYFGFTSVDVDNFAHIGGLLIGFFSSIILFRKDMIINN